MNEVRQSYAEQQNPPTDESTSANETRTAWACISTEVGYGDAYSTAVSVQEKLNDIDTTVAGKANTTHNQSASTITGLATVATSGSYNDLEDQPAIPTIPSSLPANGGNADTVDNKHASEFALSVHTHSTSDVSGLTDALSGKADINHTHDYAASTHTHTLDSVSETTSKKIMTADERTKLSGIETGANNYSHPSSHPSSMISGLATVATSGKYSDLSEKPTSMTPTSHTHAQSDVTGLSDALAGKADANHTHSVDSALSSTSTNPVQNKVINIALSGKASTSHTHAQSEITGLTSALSGKANASHTHAQSDVTGLSNALSNKANTNHTHTADSVGAIAKSLQFTADNGDVKLSYRTSDNVNVLTKICELAIGVYTVYSQSGVSGNPKTSESWRMLVHKTTANTGWVQAHGSSGSVYTNYVESGTWKGWRDIYDVSNSALWYGAYYMIASQTVTPSKPLSNCRNGWILVWGDYDANTNSVNGADQFTVAIPKLNGGGETWSGQSMILAIPTALSSSGTLTMAGKRIYVHDTKIVGHAVNNVAPANDAVLRAVYEY